MTTTFFDNKALRNDNASVAASDLIREAIIFGHLKPGQRLKEGDLGRELAISRTPIREAFLILQAEGLVDLTPKKGATVREFGLEEVEEAYELRAWLEGLAARRAAERITPSGLEALRESCSRFERLRADEDEMVTELVKENFYFHTTILETAASSRLSEMTKQLLNIPMVYRSYYWYSPAQRLASVRYHRDIVDTFESRAVDRAEHLMRDHILEAKEFMANKLRDLPETGELRRTT